MDTQSIRYLRALLSKCKHTLRGSSAIINIGHTKRRLQHRAKVLRQQRTCWGRQFPMVKAIVAPLLRKRGLVVIQRGPTQKF
jgi:hypothetical protein